MKSDNSQVRNATVKTPSPKPRVLPSLPPSISLSSSKVSSANCHSWLGVDLSLWLLLLLGLLSLASFAQQ
jgi:hypothetical protein